MSTAARVQNFLPTNISKVPVLIHGHAQGGLMYFHQIFEGIDVVSVHNPEKDVWFFGLYLGASRVGYLHFDGTPVSTHAHAISKVLPEDKNDMPEFLEKNKDRYKYYKAALPAWRYIGELEGRQIIQHEDTTIPAKS